MIATTSQCTLGVNDEPPFYVESKFHMGFASGLLVIPQLLEYRIDHGDESGWTSLDVQLVVIISPTLALSATGALSKQIDQNDSRT